MQFNKFLFCTCLFVQICESGIHKHNSDAQRHLSYQNEAGSQFYTVGITATQISHLTS